MYIVCEMAVKSAMTSGRLQNDILGKDYGTTNS